MKRLNLLIIGILFTGLLAACGTANEEAQKNTGEEPQAENEEVQKNTVGEQQAENEEVAQEEEEENNIDEQSEDGQDDGNNEGETGDSDKIRLMEKNIAYKAGGEEKEETAFLRESDNQDYSMYVLPEYELTGEEPRKDVLYFKDMDSYFMRIELLPADSDLDHEVETAKAQLDSVSSDVKEGAAEGHEWLKDAKVYTADNGEEQVSAYLIPKEEFLLKLTIFSTVHDGHEDPFLKMAETIEEK